MTMDSTPAAAAGLAPDGALDARALPGLEVLGALVPAAVAAAVCGSLCWAIGWRWALVPFLLLGVGGTALAVIDLRVMRLPDRIVLPLYGVGVVGLAAASALGAGWGRMATALICMVVLYGFFFVLHLFGPMGGGDVKLLGVLGLFLGWIGVPCVFAGLLFGTLSAAVVALSLITVGRAGRKSRLAYGPYLLLGAWLAVLLYAW